MYKVSWISPDGFFGEETASTYEEAMQIKKEYELQACNVFIANAKEETIPEPKKPEPPKVFIAFDWCGWNEQYGRFTHLPSGDTIVCQGWMDQSDWDKKQLEYFSKYPGINVHKCPGSYTTEGTEIMGSTDEICERLKKRLNLN